MGWAFLYMFVILKIPVLAAIWLVWWASRDQPEPAPPDDRGDGSDRDHPRPRRPGPPRRGPHAGVPPRPPRRIRIEAAARDRAHGR